MWWNLWLQLCWKFTAGSVGERIVDIDQHLARLTVAVFSTYSSQLTIFWCHPIAVFLLMILQHAGRSSRCDDTWRPLPRWNWMLLNCISRRLPCLQSVHQSSSDVQWSSFTLTNSSLPPSISTEARSKETVTKEGLMLEVRRVQVPRAAAALFSVPAVVIPAQGQKYSCVRWELRCCWGNYLVWSTQDWLVIFCCTVL